MTDENQKVEDTKEPEGDKKPTDPSKIEQQALEMGWRPREEFDGDDDDFIDAKEFVRRKPLFDKIENTSKELKQVRKALEQFKTHYSAVKETEYNRAMSALKEARKTALADGDGDRFESIDAEIQVDEIQKAKNTPIVQDEPAFPPEFVAWKEQNKWYDNKRFMKAFADDYGVELHKRGLSPTEVLKQVAQEVRKKFPDEFVNPRKASAPDVETSRGTTSETSIEKGLTATERSIMNTLVRGNHITKEKYLADLKAIKSEK
jgi:hypothetical protein